MKSKIFLLFIFLINTPQFSCSMEPDPYDTEEVEEYYGNEIMVPRANTTGIEVLLGDEEMTQRAMEGLRVMMVLQTLAEEGGEALIPMSRREQRIIRRTIQESMEQRQSSGKISDEDIRLAKRGRKKREEIECTICMETHGASVKCPDCKQKICSGCFVVMSQKDNGGKRIKKLGQDAIEKYIIRCPLCRSVYYRNRL